VLDGNPLRRSENERGGVKLVAVFTAEEAVGGREWQRRLGGGGGGGRGAMVHVRARRWATITDSPPPLGEGLGFAAARREEDRFVVWESGIWVSLSLPLSLMGGEEAEEQTNYCAQLQLPTGQLLTPVKNLPVHFYMKTN